MEILPPLWYLFGSTCGCGEYIRYPALFPMNDTRRGNSKYEEEKSVIRVVIPGEFLIFMFTNRFDGRYAPGITRGCRQA